MPSFPIRLFGWGRTHSSVCGTLFHHSQPVTLLKPFNGVRHFLIFQLGNQLSDCFVGMIEPQNCPRAPIKFPCMLNANSPGVKFMPLYFFDFTDGELNGCDQFGTKLPDVEAAAREAVSALANISKDVRKQYKDRVLALKVRDQSGETVLNVTLTLAVTWFPASRIELCEYASVGPVQIPGHSLGTREFTLPARGFSADRPLGGDA